MEKEAMCCLLMGYNLRSALLGDFVCENIMVCLN
jgi:hypothetical protein